MKIELIITKNDSSHRTPILGYKIENSGFYGFYGASIAIGFHSIGTAYLNPKYGKGWKFTSL